MSQNYRQIEVESNVDLESLKRFVAQKVIPTAKERDEKEAFPLNLYNELHRLGWLQAFVPEELGGSGTPTTDLIWVARTLAYGSPGMATSAAGTMLALVPIAHSGSETLKRQVFGDFVSRFCLASFCFTEPDTGSDILRTRTLAKRVPGGYLLQGKKCFITNANYADHFTVIARIEGIDHPKRALTAFYVPRSAKGLSFSQPYSKLGHRDSNTAEVFLDEVFVPEGHRLGSEGAGLQVAIHSLERSRTFFAASAVGLCDRALTIVRENLSTRMRYDKPLLSQPSIQNLFAQLHTEVQAAWYLTCAAATSWDHGCLTFKESSMAKLYSGQIATKVASAMLEMMGGWGYIREYEIERIYRDAKLYEIIEGPSFVQQVIIAKELFAELKCDKSQKEEEKPEEGKIIKLQRAA